MLGLKFTKFLSFLKEQISFSLNFASLLCAVRHNSSFISQLKFYVLSTKRACQNTNLVNFYLSSRKSKTLHFDGLLLFKSYKVSAKKVQKLSLITLQSDAKFKKNWIAVSNMTWGICWIWPNHAKVWRFLFDGLFLYKVYKVLATKIHRSYLSLHWKVMLNLNKPWPCCLKNGMRNWMNFH